MFCCGFLRLFLCVVFTIVSKTYCSLNYYLFYLLLPVCNLCFCFFVSQMSLFRDFFLWILKYIAVFMVCYWILCPFVLFSLLSYLFLLLLCKFKTKHSAILVFLKLQSLVSIHAYRTGL